MSERQGSSLSATYRANPPYDQRPRDEGHVKQPLNPFLLWCKTKRADMLKEQPGMKQCDINKVLGGIWKNMSEEDKQPFVDEARELKAEHLKNYPDYKRTHKKTKKTRESGVFKTPASSSQSSKSSGFSSSSAANQGPQFYPTLASAQQYLAAATAPMMQQQHFTGQYNFSTPTTTAQGSGNASSGNANNQASGGTPATSDAGNNPPFFF